VRITNPLAEDESVMRASMVVGLLRAWGRNVERGTGNVLLGELGSVFAHPDTVDVPRTTKGGVGGTVLLQLPSENERYTILLGRPGDDATTAVALWSPTSSCAVAPTRPPVFIQLARQYSLTARAAPNSGTWERLTPS
jgi:hypothetical protein